MPVQVVEKGEMIFRKEQQSDSGGSRTGNKFDETRAGAEFTCFWEIWQKIFEFYNDDWSLEQISGTLKMQGVCVSY